MRNLLIIELMIAVVGSVAANDLSNIARDEKTNDHVGLNPGTPGGRQGGEDMATALAILEFPFSDTGNTTDNLDDYSADCPYTGSTSPDFGTPFQSLLADGNGNRTFGGQSGWYDSFIDTDWIIVVMGEYGLIEWTVIAEQETRIFLLGPQDCVDVGIVESIWLDPCEPATMSIQSSPGELIWLWVGPAEFAPPAGFEGHEYNYLCTFTGLYPEGCATDEISFGGIKSLYR